MHEIRKRVVFRAMLKGGMSKAAISRELGISRRTAGRWAAADSAGRGHEALSYGPRTTGPSILDPYKEIVRIRLSEYPDLSAVRVFRELRESGYRGSYDVVKRYVRQVRPQPGKEPVVRFETAPRQQGQVDFAEFPLPWGKRHALLVVLGYSRLLWFQFFERQTTEVLMRGLEAAFAYFGGVPWELLFDQMKAVIIEDQRASAGELLRNAEFERFSHHHGFVIRACRPYEAGEFDEEVEAADLLQEYKAKIAALERLVGRQALEIEFLKGAKKHEARRKSAPTFAVAGPSACPSPEDVS